VKCASFYASAIAEHMGWDIIIPGREVRMSLDRVGINMLFRA